MTHFESLICKVEGGINMGDNINNKKSDILDHINRILNNISMFKKILISPIIVILILMVVGLISFISTKKQITAVDEIYKIRFVNYQDTSSIVTKLTYTHSSLYKIITWVSAEYQKEQIDKLSNNIKQMLNEIVDETETIIKSGRLNSEETEIYNQLMVFFTKI